MTPRKKPPHPQPMQPMTWDGNVLRFQTNAIVAHIVCAMTTGMKMPSYSELMAMPWADTDRDQFNMLHGYSVSGLPYRSSKTRRIASDLAVKAVAKRYPTRKR